jgi:hypothetical protein
MSALEGWLAQLRKGALSGPAFRVAVQNAVASGEVERAALRGWLDSPAAKAFLPPQLAQDLEELSKDPLPQRPPDPDGSAARKASGETASEADSARWRPGGAPPVGSIIDGRYELVERLGGGGMGDVYKALDRLAHSQQDPDPYVALKILKPKLQGNQKAVLALQREAHRARRLTHSNILRIHQFEQDRQTRLYFIVMELLSGRSVESLIDERPDGRPWDQIARCVAQVCAGLQRAHQQGIVHSDIKPSNLFLTSQGEIKILDFGVAAPISNNSHETLIDARKLGARTPAYSSLETFLGLKAHYSDDVYSLACVIYEWLCGRYPYASTEDGTPVPAPKALKLGLQPAPIPGLPGWQNRALRKALSLRRSERTQTIAEFWRSMSVAPATSFPSGRIAAAAAGALLAAALVLGAMKLFSTRKAPAVVAAQQPLAGCPGPASRTTLDEALALGIKAQRDLARQAQGSKQYAQDLASVLQAAQCLRALEKTGMSNPDSVKFLRKASALD